MVQNLKKAIDELFADYEKSLMKAAEFAFNRAVKDIGEQATNVLDEYYDSYSPSSYGRTDSLYRCIVPYGNIDKSATGIRVQVGVDYDASMLDDVYYGSKKYSPTDPEWVITNYLAGIHPATDGSRITGEAYYYENIDPVSPTEKMQIYLNDYVKNDFYINVLLGFAKQVY